MKLPIEALQLAHLAATDASRTSILWMEVKQLGSTSVRASATDGHVLGIVEWEAELLCIGEACYLKAADVRDALKRTPKKVRMEGASLQGGVLTFMDGASVAIGREPDEAVDYPTVEQIVPIKMTGSEEHEPFFGMDFKLFGMFQSWATACNRNTIFRVQADGPLNPVRVETFDTSDCPATFVAMPCRL